MNIKITLQNKIDAIRASLKKHVEKTENMIAWMERNKEAIEDIGIIPSCVVGYFDFDHPDRCQILKIIKAFPGDWEKEQNNYDREPRMNYVRAKTETEPPLRIWSGELPPSCKIVTEKVLVPEHYEEKTKIVCGNGKDAA